MDSTHVFIEALTAAKNMKSTVSFSKYMKTMHLSAMGYSSGILVLCNSIDETGGHDEGKQPEKDSCSPAVK